MGCFWLYLRKAVNLPYKAHLRKSGITYHSSKNAALERKTDKNNSSI